MTTETEIDKPHLQVQIPFQLPIFYLEDKIKIRRVIQYD